jgi:hypothetical protein
MKAHMPTPNTCSRTRSVLVSIHWATLWCRGHVRVTLWYLYHFIVKTSTVTSTFLLTMGSHHTNRRPWTDSLVICSQNRLWCPKLLPPELQLDRHARVWGNVFCTPGAQKTSPTASPFGSQWILAASGRRAALQPRQRLAHRRGHVDGPRAQLCHSHHGKAPNCDGFWAFGRGRRLHP